MAKKRKIPKTRIYLLAFVLLLVIGGGFLLFNEYGFVKYTALNYELDSLRTEIRGIERENEHLRSELDSLRKEIPAKIEEVAREHFGMRDTNEVVLQVEEEEKKPEE